MFRTPNSDADDNISGIMGDSHVGFGRGWFRHVTQTPQVGMMRTPRFSSTRMQPSSVDSNPQVTGNIEFSTLISDLANQIGQSIAAQLQSNVSTHSQSSDTFQTATNTPSELNLSGVKLVMQSDIKEPSVFRGDGSDKCYK